MRRCGERAGDGAASAVTVTELRVVRQANLQACAIAETLHQHEKEDAEVVELLGAASDETLRLVVETWHEHYDGNLHDRLGKGSLREHCALLHAAAAQQAPPDSAAILLDAAEHAANLRRAAGYRILEVLLGMPESQLAKTSRAFAAQSVALGKAGGDLIDHVQRTCAEGPVRSLLLRRLARIGSEFATPIDASQQVSLPGVRRQARQLHAAGKGLVVCGTDEDVFIELIGFADAAQAAALRYEYAMRFGHTLASAVRDETHSDLQALLLAFLHPPPSALQPADDALAQAQARALWRASEGCGVEAAEWTRVFGEASAAQLAAIMRFMARHARSGGLERGGRITSLGRPLRSMAQPDRQGPGVPPPSAVSADDAWSETSLVVRRACH